MEKFYKILSVGELKEAVKAYHRKYAFSIIGLLTLFVIGYLSVSSVYIRDDFRYLVLIMVGLLTLLSAFDVYKKNGKFVFLRDAKQEYDRTEELFEKTIRSTKISDCETLINRLTAKQQQTQAILLDKLYIKCISDLNARLAKLNYEKKTNTLTASYISSISTNDKNIERSKQKHPLLKLEKDVQSALESMESHRVISKKLWDIKYESFSWWNKFKHAQGPDFSDLDNRILELKEINHNIKVKHTDDIKDINQSYEKLRTISKKRIRTSYNQANEILEKNRETTLTSNELLQKAFWCSTLSVPVSLWNDFSDAGNIYDSLRNVNGNFAEMSDSEIWWESLWMLQESLTGLASLTKGAYFEQLVANDTGGQLFEHFNHKDTDIIIDGVAVQLKATDSVAYIESVDSHIPVITTSEVAEKTGMIDSGYSNEELSNSVDLALGGSVIDVGDTTIDALLTGVGGLGIFATINGINHAQEQYDNGKDGLKAIDEGIAVAVEGTAKGLVDASEFVLMSGPVRFLGRALKKGINKLEGNIE